MQSFNIMSSRERWTAALVGTVAGSSVLACALLVFMEDSQTPWISEDSAYASSVERCHDERSSSDRHRCVRQIAAIAATPGASAPFRLTRR